MIMNSNVKNKQKTNSVREVSFFPMQQLRQEADSLFDEMMRSSDFPFKWFGRASGQLKRDLPIEQKAFFRPSLNVSGSDKGYLVSVELPGVEEKNIKVEIMGRSLIISGEKKHHEEQKKQEAGYYYAERSFGQFKRVLEVPCDSLFADITAEYKDGVLNINIPRNQQPDEKTKKIEISKE